MQRIKEIFNVETTNSIKRIKLKRVRCASRLVGFLRKRKDGLTKSASRFEGELKTFEGEESVPSQNVINVL